MELGGLKKKSDRSWAIPVFLPGCSAENNCCWFHSKAFLLPKKTKRQKFRHCLNATVTGAEILQHQAHLKPLLGGVPQPLLRLCLLVVFSPWLCLGSDGCALDFSKSSFLSDLLWLLNNALIISLSFSPRLLWGAGLGRHVPLLHAASRSFSMAGAPSWGRAVRAVPGLGKPLGVILTVRPPPELRSG